MTITCVVLWLVCYFAFTWRVAKKKKKKKEGMFSYMVCTTSGPSIAREPIYGAV